MVVLTEAVVRERQWPLRGVVMGRYRMRSLMRQHGLRSAWKRKFVHTTDSQHALPI